MYNFYIKFKPLQCTTINPICCILLASIFVNKVIFEMVLSDTVLHPFLLITLSYFIFIGIFLLLIYLINRLFRCTSNIKLLMTLSVFIYIIALYIYARHPENIKIVFVENDEQDIVTNKYSFKDVSNCLFLKIISTIFIGFICVNTIMNNEAEK